jgi:hypothetical protein
MQPGILHRNLSSQFPAPSDHHVSFQVVNLLIFGVFFTESTLFTVFMLSVLYSLYSRQ